jgi:hypothetical protein
MAEKNSKVAGKIVLGFGILIGVWAIAAFVGGLSQAGSLPELARQYLIAIGHIAPLHTLVDYCTHIKGVECFICVAFFVALPVVYLYINKEKIAVHTKR